MSTDEEFKVYNLDNKDTAELYGLVFVKLKFSQGSALTHDVHGAHGFILVKLKFLIDFFSKKLQVFRAEP